MEYLIHVILSAAIAISFLRIGVIWERNRQDRQRRRYFERQTKL